MHGVPARPTGLDSKGWTGADTKALGNAVDRAIGDGTVVLYGSHFHLEEASRIHDDDARRRFMEFFWCRVKWNVLVPTQELAVEEAQRRRTLEGTEPFEEFWRRQDLRRVSRSKSDLDGLTAGVKTFVDKCVADSAARRASATQKLEAAYANLTPAEVSKRWWKDADAVEDWVKDYIASSRAHLGLGDDEAEWPKPHSKNHPTLELGPNTTGVSRASRAGTRRASNPCVWRATLYMLDAPFSRRRSQ